MKTIYYDEMYASIRSIRIVFTFLLELEELRTIRQKSLKGKRDASPLRCFQND